MGKSRPANSDRLKPPGIIPRERYWINGGEGPEVLSKRSILRENYRDNSIRRKGTDHYLN
jgi:hypothetical protein